MSLTLSITLLSLTAQANPTAYRYLSDTTGSQDLMHSGIHDTHPQLILRSEAAACLSLGARGTRSPSTMNGSQL